MTSFGTRKIISGLVLLVVGVAITFIKGDIPVNLLSLMQWIYLSFVAGNSAENLSRSYVQSKKVKEEVNESSK